jgi:hypothetical protein
MGNANGKFLRILAALLLAGSARAQLPGVGIPDTVTPPVTLPDLRKPGDLAAGVDGTADRTLRRLAGARMGLIEGLAREHRAELERDAAGELVVRAEVVAIDLTEAALKLALDNRFL